MATDEDYPIDLPILVIEAQIFVAVKKFPFLPNKLIPTSYFLCISVMYSKRFSCGCLSGFPQQASQRCISMQLKSAPEGVWILLK